MVSEQQAAELERLRNELIEQKQTAVTREEATIETGQLESTNAPTTEPMAKYPNQQAEIINSEEGKLHDAKSESYRFGQKV